MVIAGTFPPDFIMEYLSTFLCVACTLVGSRLEEVTSPSYYPDLPRRRRGPLDQPPPGTGSLAIRTGPWPNYPSYWLLDKWANVVKCA